MTLPQIISRNQLQRIATTALNLRKVLSGGTDGDFYTCPVGKKALIKGTAICTGLGAAASVDLNVAGVAIHQWQATAVRDVSEFQVDVDQIVPFDVQLDAGEILQYSQDSGTNAEMNINAEILETPI